MLVADSNFQNHVKADSTTEIPSKYLLMHFKIEVTELLNLDLTSTQQKISFSQKKLVMLQKYVILSDVTRQMK